MKFKSLRYFSYSPGKTTESRLAPEVQMKAQDKANPTGSDAPNSAPEQETSTTGLG